MPLQTFVQQAIAAIKDGQRDAARRLLAQAIEEDARDVNAWLWLTEVVDSDQERLECLQQVLELDPQHKQAQRAAQLLQAKLAAAQEQTLQSDAEPAQPADTPESTEMAHTVRALVAALRDSKPEVRLKVVAMLGKSDDARAVKWLIHALQDQDDLVRQAAIESLVKIGQLAVEPLAAVLQGRNKSARQAAAEALVKIGQPAIKVLVSSLQHWDRRVRQTAAEALDELGWQPDSEDLEAACRVAKAEWDNCIEMGDPAVKSLIAVLGDIDSSVRLAAVKTLDKIGPQRAVEPLVAGLKDKDSRVRQAVCEALVKAGEPAIEPLVVALQTWNSHHIRQRVAELLDKLGWQPDCREAGATYWIAKAEWDKCIEIGKPAIEPLVATLRDRDSGVRWAAADTLDSLGWRPDRERIGATYWIAKSEWNRCVEIGEPAVEPLIAVLRDRESWVRQAAAGALERIGTPEARAAVEEWKRLVTA